MKTGIMNNPSNPVYDEAVCCGNAGFDFLDLTVEGPGAIHIDIDKLGPILDAHGLGATIMNIHPCYLSPPAMRQDLVSFHMQALPPIVEMAASHGLTLVLENFRAPFDRVATFKDLFRQVPGLKLHLDFGHTNFGADNHEVFCGELGEQIRHVHFSDNRSRFDDHMPLGVGTVDWENAVNSLKAVGYDDTITLEIFCHDPGMQYKYLGLSRDLVRDLWNRT